MHSFYNLLILFKRREDIIIIIIIILHVIMSRLCGSHPFPQDNDAKMMYNVTHGIFSFEGEVWRNVSDEAKDFISRLLCVDPRQRMTARQVQIININININCLE